MKKIDSAKGLVMKSFLVFMTVVCAYNMSLSQTRISDSRLNEKKSDLASRGDLHFNKLAKSWDEGIPLGNGMVGAIVWQKEGSLRIALDRADLWDFRTPSEFQRPEFKFSWVVAQANKGDYKPVQDLFDLPYDRDPYPTKIPAAALEFKVQNIDEIESVRLELENALCAVRWKNGTRLLAFVHATEQRGWFRFENVNGEVQPGISPPPYASTDASKPEGISGPGGNDLRRLGYSLPKITYGKNEISYHQECSNGFAYDVWVGWIMSENNVVTGCWTVTPNKPYRLSKSKSRMRIEDISEIRFEKDFQRHCDWWKGFWNKCSIEIPDSILEAQWYREMYKFGSASRRGAPPITLQAVWTADNQRLPPWKGDFHNDLNTQLSYWPAYSGNHLDEESGFLEWLWDCKPVAEQFTKKYFGTDGLDFPGVATLTGEPMGGWIQYSLSPTTSAWLAHHFYLHWRYSMDRKFLRERAYPWVRAVAKHLDQISVRDSVGRRKLPLSSSPEINDNNLSAWFHSTTNYDVALIRWLYGAAREMATELGMKKEGLRWETIQSEWPDLALSENDQKLLVAPGVELKESHRHFSHLMAIHPLGIVAWDRSELDKRIIASSLNDLDKLGTDWWCGYSYSWLGSMAARGRDGERAAGALKTFATCFCLPNSLHVNGDQSGTGKSKFTYRPFTLEGNLAFAAGVQEMLLQSQDGVIRVFPAIPNAWKDVSFTNLRAEGAFLISAKLRNGKLEDLRIKAEVGGRLKLANPFGTHPYLVDGATISDEMKKGSIIEIQLGRGKSVTFARADQ
jgi:alpha-L-fucosidase 2